MAANRNHCEQRSHPIPEHSIPFRPFRFHTIFHRSAQTEPEAPRLHVVQSRIHVVGVGRGEAVSGTARLDCQLFGGGIGAHPTTTSSGGPATYIRERNCTGTGSELVFKRTSPLTARPCCEKCGPTDTWLLSLRAGVKPSSLSSEAS